MIFRAKIAFLVFLCLTSLGFGAQRPFKELTINNGLPHTDAHYAVQDAKGFLWFATLDGLCRYDGGDMLIYRNIHSDLNSISNNRINCLEYDHVRKGLWIGTQGGGLNFLDMEAGKFIRLVIKDGQGERLTGIISLKKLNNGAIWVGTTKGIYYANPGKIITSGTPFKTAASQIKYVIESIYEHENRDVWAGTLNGLLHLPAGAKRFTMINPEIFRSVNAITRFDRYHILLGTTNGLYKMNIATYHFIKLSAMNVTSVLKDRQDRIWVGTLFSGLFQLDILGSGQQHFSFGNNEFRSDNIRNIFIDKFESIFVCTAGAGIKIINQNNHTFTSYPLKLHPKEFSKIKKPVTFYAIGKKYIWIGTKRSGIVLYNREKESYTFFKIKTQFVDFSLDQEVLAINETKDHDLLIGTGGGLFLLENKQIEKAIQSKELPLMANLLKAHGATRINKILRDEKQRIWIATSRGLMYLNADLNFIGYINSATIPVSLSNDFVNDILITKAADKKNITVWLATKGGISKLIYNDKALRLIKNINIRAGTGDTDLFSNWISLLHLDKNGNIWVGTIGGGLSRLVNKNGEAFTFKTITTDDGLQTNDIETLLEDEEGNFWIGGVGLTKYNPLKKSFSFYNANDGLQSNAIKFRSAFKTDDGEMIFGGINGFNIFYPGHIRKNTDVFSPQLTNLFINNIPIKVGAEIEGDVILNKTLSYSSSISLNHKIKNFGIEFSSVHSHDFSKIIYRYRLKGFDNNWIYANSKKRFVSYSGLPAGNYKFELQASGGGGVWNPSSTTLDIEILPSFWQSNVGYLFYVFVILVALFLQRKYALIRLDTKHKLELQKARQEQDLKLYEEKMQFFTTISHELRTPLTLIMTPIEQIIEQSDFGPHISHRLEIAHKNAQRLKSLIDQILDVRKLESGKYILHTKDVSITKVLNSIFIQFEDLATQKSLDYSFKTSTNAIMKIDSGKIEQVLINLLANAIRFANKEGKITLEADQDANQVVIKVSNTGSYLTEQQQSRIFEPFYQTNEKDNIEGTGLGLTISKYLIELHEGKIEVQSFEKSISDDSKTTFVIYLPIIDAAGEEEAPVNEHIMKSSEEEEIAFVETADAHKSTLIIIDDNEELRSLLYDEFQKEYRVLEAVDGKQGLKLIRKTKPDLVITDIMMPIVDGLTLCKAIKADISTSHIPIIILTARVTDNNRIEGLEAMADDYLCKPFNLKELRIKIKNLIHYHENLKIKINNNIALEPARLNFDSRDERIIKEIIAIIEKNIDNHDFTVDFLCSKAAMSRPVLFRKIKELTGMSIQIFILDIRLKRAAQLLEGKTFSVSEVMYRTGFSSPSYFNKAFKKKYSVTPTHFPH